LLGEVFGADDDAVGAWRAAGEQRCKSDERNGKFNYQRSQKVPQGLKPVHLYSLNGTA
jgi:hypothetical protein